MFKILLATTFLATAAPSLAATQVYDGTVEVGGNQQWGGTLGLDFDVNQTIYVTSLGSFDAGRDGITHNIFVGIFNATTGLLVGPAVNLNGTANTGGAYDSVAIATLTLTPGHYQIGAWGYNNADDINFNNGGPGGPISFNTLGGALTAIGSHYSDFGSPGAFATNPDVGSTRYGAGTFSAYIPEPATWGMMIAGFGLVGATLRRRGAVAA
jgi:hypothetical protein